MRLRIFVLSTAALGVAACLAFAAKAGEMPKAGTIHAKSAISGSMKMNMIGTEGDNALLTYDENGAVEGFGPKMTSHCFGVSELVKRVVEAHGYCIDADPDGDQIVWKWISEKFPWFRDQVPQSYEVMMGVGKYAGMTGKATVTCVTGGSPSQYELRCDVEGSYKLP